jgi:hypothetical protein
MIHFKKMKLYSDSKNRMEYYYLVNSNNEIILRSLNYKTVREKKSRLDFIARVKGTYYPLKFRIVDSKMNLLS